MGLMIHSLELLSEKANRDYYLYLLDYGWDEPLANSLRANFAKMADFASRNDAVIIMGVGDIGHFDNEVLSWHKINGENAEKLLPAILITRSNPHRFRECCNQLQKQTDNEFSFLLIPIKDVCKNATELTSVIQGIFLDIKNKRELKNFSIKKEIKRRLAACRPEIFHFERPIGIPTAV